MLFLSANGLVDVSNHQYEMKALRGSARKDIVSGIGFTVGALSMIGIPLFAGFAPKIFLGIGSMESNFHMIVTFLALALSTLLNALYYGSCCCCFLVQTQTTANARRREHGITAGKTKEECIFTFFHWCVLLY